MVFTDFDLKIEISIVVTYFDSLNDKYVRNIWNKIMSYCKI